MRFVVGPVAEFPSGMRRIVRVGGREIGIFRFADEFYAVRNSCPHQGAPLCLGRIQPRLVSDEPGVVKIDEQSPPLIVCPWHAWQYDARTGEAYAPGDPHARSYRISVEPGERLAQEPEAPFAAETFPVYLENEYVVLDA